jgi:aquaporin Z
VKSKWYKIVSAPLPNALIEGWALGMFMLSAIFFAALLELPSSPLHKAIENGMIRRFLMGCAMGLTAIGIIYSPWGKRSGAHMNPAMTLTQWVLGKITGSNALSYILAQTVGGTMGVFLCYLFFPKITTAPEVNFVQTLPSNLGVGLAFILEVLMSFVLVLMVLFSSNNSKTAAYTGVFAGILVMLFITFESPFSGMSINPARTFASAVLPMQFQYFWLYLIAPPLGMLGAAMIWKTWICKRNHFHCQYHALRSQANRKPIE